MDGLFHYGRVLMQRMRAAYTWVLPRPQLQLGLRTAVMGILNVTPDSFSDGGAWLDPAKAAERACAIEAEGADILDIGGESSRPGSLPVTAAEEMRRVLPVIEALAGRLRIPISVDTYRAEVAERALKAGAEIVNDIGAFRFDAGMPGVVARHRAGIVLMHSRGTRETLHLQPPMADAVGETIADLRQAVEAARAAGIVKEAIVVDPGIGFGKKAGESLEVLRDVAAMSSQLEYPLLVGPSRKSFIGHIRDDGDARLWGTAAAVAASVLEGAHIVRVHDVRPMRMLVDVLDAIKQPKGIDR
jgi:dihydropteroate synthase